MSDDPWVSYLPLLLNGAWITLYVTAIAMVCGILLGFALAMMKLSRFQPLRSIASVYGTVVRGLPLLIQVLLIYFALPLLTGIRMPAVVAGTIAMIIFTAGFMSEIIRAGIEAVDRGQLEAGRAIGFSYWNTMRLIILPQALKLIIPNIANQFSITLKDTSLLSVIGVMELTMSGQSIYSVNFDTVRVLGMVGVMYLLIYLVVEKITAMIETRLKK